MSLFFMTSMYVDELEDTFIVEIECDFVSTPNGKPSAYDSYAEGETDDVEICEIKVVDNSISEETKKEIESILEGKKYVEKAEIAILRMAKEF